GNHRRDVARGCRDARPHWLHWCRPELARSAQRVDEVAVALVWRNPSRAGVGLTQVAVVLEGRHVVPHGGGGHVHCGRDVTGADRLGGLDVLLHNRAEDGGFSFVEHQWFHHSQLGCDWQRDVTDPPFASAAFGTIALGETPWW